MGLELTPKKLVLVIILVLGGYYGTRAARGKVGQFPGGTTLLKINDTITWVRFIGAALLFGFIFWLLTKMSEGREKKHRK